MQGNGIYFGLFRSRECIETEFEVKLDSDIEILFAIYEYEDYSGDAFVLYRQEGNLFEVNGSHCSCDGLEHQWEGEETSVKSLRYVVDHGHKYAFGYAAGSSRIRGGFGFLGVRDLVYWGRQLPQ